MAIRSFQEALRDILRRLTALERRVTKFPPKGAPGVPPGALSPYAGPTAPTGWLLCDGATYQQADYPELYAALGTHFGSGSAGTFSVPDLRGRVVVGISSDAEFNVRGETGGAKTHTLTVAQMPSHNHTGSSVGNRSVGGDYSNANGTSLMARIRGGSTETGRFSDSIPGSTHNHALTIASQGGGGAHNNLQPYMALAYIIKA